MADFLCSVPKIDATFIAKMVNQCKCMWGFILQSTVTNTDKQQESEGPDFIYIYSNSFNKSSLKTCAD